MSIEEQNPQNPNGHDRALKLARKTSFSKSSIDEIEKLVPKDWADGEFEVDDFLASIRNGKQS